jgi:hypothetical protein
MAKKFIVVKTKEIYTATSESEAQEIHAWLLSIHPDCQFEIIETNVTATWRLGRDPDLHN